jgi:hypothetical protein
LKVVVDGSFVTVGAVISEAGMLSSSTSKGRGRCKTMTAWAPRLSKDDDWEVVSTLSGN